MIVFAAYAVAVWYAAARWRRRWGSFASVAIGVLLLLLVAYLHLCLNEWTHGRIYLRVLQGLLYPYIVLVGVVGLYICVLPRRASDFACVRCEYSLAGLSGETGVCPECGAMFDEAMVSRGAAARPSRPAAPLLAGPRWPASAMPAPCHHAADG